MRVTLLVAPLKKCVKILEVKGDSLLKKRLRFLIMAFEKKIRKMVQHPLIRAQKAIIKGKIEILAVESLSSLLIAVVALLISFYLEGL